MIKVASTAQETLKELRKGDTWASFWQEGFNMPKNASIRKYGLALKGPRAAFRRIAKWEWISLIW